MVTLAAPQRVKIATFRIHAFPRLYNTIQNQSRVDCFFSFPFPDQSLFQRSCPGFVLPSRFIGSEICMSIGEREVRLRLRCVSSQGASRFRTLLCPCSHAASMAPSSQLTYPSSDFSRALWISGACSCFLSFFLSSSQEATHSSSIIPSCNVRDLYQLSKQNKTNV